MSDIKMQVVQRKQAFRSERQRLEALRRHRPVPGKRLEHYVEQERAELRKDTKLAEAGKHGD